MVGPDRPRLAVVGAGVAGLTAAYLLQRRYDVTLYEADARLGGHAHTHDVTDSAGRSLAVDTGFLVHNARTYPYLLRLFNELGVRTQDTEMSMSVRCDGCGLEYAGARGLSGVFADPRSLARGRFLRLLGQVKRFHWQARDLLATGDDGVTLGMFLRDNGFSRYFAGHFAVPLVSAVWSCGPGLATDYPARYLFRFLANHGMLSVKGSPTWRTVVGGSRSYVERAVKELSSVRTATPVRAIHRFADGVRVRDDDDQVATFDRVVIASHPDRALRLLTDPTPGEVAVLGSMPYSTNPTVLHTDASVLPSRARAQASWNYRLPSCDPAPDAVRVSYDITRLQRLSTHQRFVVSLNESGEVDPATVVARMTYHHPIYTPASLAAQARLPELTIGRTAYAGAYHGWGFHEDGCRSGVAAAAAFGVDYR